VIHDNPPSVADRGQALPVDATEVRWDASDLDRCIHGRHSIDSCVSCPDGMSAGNRFLAEGGDSITIMDGDALLRIGTTMRGNPILVRPDRRREWAN
jgi:hypothetical protein